MESATRHLFCVCGEPTSLPRELICGITIPYIRKAIDKLKKKTKNQDKRAGMEIIRCVLLGPVKLIAAGCDLDGSMITWKGENSNEVDFGFKAFAQRARSHGYSTIIKIGMIVPMKVKRVVQQNLVLVAGLLLTIEAAIVNIKEKRRSAGGDGDLPDAIGY